MESVPGTEKTLQSICAATNKVSVESDVEIDSDGDCWDWKLMDIWSYTFYESNLRENSLIVTFYVW